MAPCLVAVNLWVIEKGAFWGQYSFFLQEQA